jgi:hypothetical protein
MNNSATPWIRLEAVITSSHQIAFLKKGTYAMTRLAEKLSGPHVIRNFETSRKSRK